MFLLGSTIDWKEEKFKEGFTFENPKRNSPLWMWRVFHNKLNFSDSLIASLERDLTLNLKTLWKTSLPVS